MDINSIIEMIERMMPSDEATGVSVFHDGYNTACDDIIEQLRKMSDWQSIDSAEDIDNKYQGEPVLCFDGCDISIDFTDIDVDTGVTYMSNGTEVTHWMPLPPPPSKAL